MITFKFPFKLISKDNEKICNRQGRYFLSKKYKQFDKEVRKYAVEQYKGDPLECGLMVEIIAFFRTKVHADCFNLPKGVIDSLQGIAYLNDRQIKTGIVGVREDKLNDDRFVVIVEKIS